MMSDSASANNPGFPSHQKVRRHFPFSLHFNFAPAFEIVTVAAQNVVHFLGALRLIRQPRRVHPRGHVDRVAPNIVLRLPGANHAGHDGADIHADPQHEVVVAVLVDGVEFVPHAEDEFDELGEVSDGADAAVFALGHNLVLGDEAHGGHVRGADGLDLVDGPVALFADQLMKQERFN